MAFLGSIFRSGCLRAVICCFLLAVTYIGSLYIWRTKNHRDHPSTIKKRFISVCIMISISPLFVLYGGDLVYFKPNCSLLSLLGVRLSGLIPAIVLPLILTMILFAGPLSLHYFDGVCGLYLEPRYWSSNMKNLIWLRNHLVAPLSEEFTFRACMLPILVPCLGAKLSIYICPLFFGVAHFHHLIEKLTRTTNVRNAVLQSCFQFAYTTLFGTYSAYLFLRTGHFMAPFIAHAFCNHMGFPDFSEVFSYKQPMLTLLIIIFISGLIGWAFLLEPLTNPWVYSNDIYSL